MQAAFFLAQIERQHILAGLGFPGHLAFADGNLVAQCRQRALGGSRAVGNVVRRVLSVRLMRCAEILAARNALAVRSMSRSWKE
jgi:hypothetical protein